jgi:hypothetical protein
VKCPDGGSGCPNGKVDWSGRAGFCDLLLGTTSERHLSSVMTVNPVGLYRFPPGAAAALCHLFFASFVVSCVFSVFFMRISRMLGSSLQFISTPSMFLYPFTDLF